MVIYIFKTHNELVFFQNLTFFPGKRFKRMKNSLATFLAIFHPEGTNDVDVVAPERFHVLGGCTVEGELKIPLLNFPHSGKIGGKPFKCKGPIFK